jgi:hypothetical protein
MSWQQIYLNYDQDALALYANIGLIRRARKDIEANKIEFIQQENNNVLQFNADGQQVCLPAQGIQAASCSCPAHGHCKHIISAVLWLQAHNSEHSLANGSANSLANNSANNSLPEETPSHCTKQDDKSPIKPLTALDDLNNVNNQAKQDQIKPITPLTNVLTELLSLDASKLLKKVGKVNTLTAYELVCNWQENNLLTIQYQQSQQSQQSQLRITVPESSEPIIYIAGTGFDGMISALPIKQKMAVHLAIIAYLFEQNNQAWQWPVTVDQIKNETQLLSPEEITLIKQIQTYIYKLIYQGLSHISHNQLSHLQLFNISAKTQNLPRLAAMLRQLCQLVELLANRHFTVEEQDILLFLGQIKAYTEMLLHNQGEPLSKLRGKITRQYKTTEQALDLLPLGGRWWQSRTGAVGATFYFWDIKQQQYQETTLARADKNDINFNRVTIWNSMSIWQTSPDRLMQNAITLHHPRISQDGELASSGSTATLQQNGWNDENYLKFKATTGFQNWSVLNGYLQNSHLDDVLFNEVVFVHIQNNDKPYFDEIRQSLVWCVKDAEKNQLFLRLFWDEYRKSRIEVLRSFLETQNQPLTILVKVVKNESFLDLEPFALLYKAQKTNEIKTLNLDFEDSWRRRKTAVAEHMFLSNTYTMRKMQLSENNYTKDSLSTFIIQPLLTILESVACSGRLELFIDQKQQLKAIQHDCDTLGLNSLSLVLNKILSNQLISITHLLQAVYLCYLLKKMHYQLPIQLIKPNC